MFALVDALEALEVILGGSLLRCLLLLGDLGVFYLGGAMEACGAWMLCYTC